jgi:hypothetical protein
VSATESNEEAKLVADIRKSKNSDDVVETTLKTDEQVIARVTDGIYRQPASALRELISNAYDADATRVVIQTDPPRFERIVIEDNGRGMTPDVLGHLLLHIGGSAKRNQRGVSLGITNAEDSFHSPGGRRLIGKIGIGLFSVAQLTHSFQIITKVKDDPYRSVATVALRQFSDFKASNEKGEEVQFESGKVKIWRERAADKPSHGTTIVLTSIRPQARDTLRSREIWSAIEQNEQVAQADEKQTIDPPKYHIGSTDRDEDFLKATNGNFGQLPWENTDTPDEAFGKLVKCVWDEVGRGNPNSQLSKLFDYYLRMVWQLALSVPLPYVDGHLFDQPVSGWAQVFELSNKAKGAAQLVGGGSNETIRKLLRLTDPADKLEKFDVFFDQLALKRPIRFRDLPTTDHSLKHPLVFIGKCSERFGQLSP